MCRPMCFQNPKTDLSLLKGAHPYVLKWDLVVSVCVFVTSFL